ncbi:MAG: family transporter [Chitinophagaceae bacterium]|nr:family transporter [Chitinophagaceae bacterium]
MVVLLLITGYAVFMAAKVQMSYDFSRAIPTDNIKYIEYQQFRKQFSDDGNMVVAGVQANNFYTVSRFNALGKLQQNLKAISGVEELLTVPAAVDLKKSDSAEKLEAVNLFTVPYSSQTQLDSDKAKFENLPFYNGLLYNASTQSYLIGVKLNKGLINSKARTGLINKVTEAFSLYEKETGQLVHISGLPFIRTRVADRIAKEMNWFLMGSLLLSAITLLIFFRSFSAMIMSLVVVGIGVAWSLGTMVLLGYKITLLTALIPPLIVVIGIPNCIYFLNKYHSAYKESGNKNEALITMVGRMGIVTLFCNIAAAIGFAVFAFTRSDLLKEFGVVAGINIMALFFISLVFIPVVLSYLSPPKAHQMRYLDNKTIERFLLKIEGWAFNHSRWVIGITVIAIVVSVAGITRIKSEGFIVDDLPQNDKIYTDLKWFENNFHGVMPLEILIDTKKRNGLTKSLEAIEKIDSFSHYIASLPQTSRPLSFVEGLKFVRQATYDGDSTNYATPTEFDIPVLGKYLKGSGNKDSAKAGQSNMAKMLTSYMDTARQRARISVNMKDIGSVQLPVLLDTLKKVANATFDSSKYKVTFTGASVTFLEGSSFIIKGLKESIFWAFILIAVCMLYLFRSFRILVCSLIPNIIPLLITAGVMGWAGIRLKPSTVLIFSVALGIAIDVTIRFLVNYKQELPVYHLKVPETLRQTIRHTGISIIYTSLVLIAGFIVFCISDFGGTKTLGWLTSLTLITGTITNLVLLPVLILKMQRRERINS